MLWNILCIYDPTHALRNNPHKLMSAVKPMNNQRCVYFYFSSTSASHIGASFLYFFVERGQIGTPERGAGKSQSRGKGPGKGNEDHRGNEVSLFQLQTV